MSRGWNRVFGWALLAGLVTGGAPPPARANATSWGRIKTLYAETPARVELGEFTAVIEPGTSRVLVRDSRGREAARAWRDPGGRVRVTVAGHAFRTGSLIGDLSASLCGALAARVEEKCAIAVGPSPWGQLGCLLVSAATFALCMTLDDIMAIEPPPNQGGYGLGTPPVNSGPGARP